MSHYRLLPLWMMFLLWTLFGVLIVATYDSWPAEVATHFDLGGNPNGWMSRSANLVAFLALGFGLPIAMYGIFSLAGFFPARFVNLPRREYWLAPERRDATMRELRRQSLWLGCLSVLFVAGLYISTLEANLQKPAKLSSNSVLLVLGGFFAGLAIWVVLLLRRFSRTTPV
jgi:serine/threonine-protein kinase